MNLDLFEVFDNNISSPTLINTNTSLNDLIPTLNTNNSNNTINKKRQLDQLDDNINISTEIVSKKPSVSTDNTITTPENEQIIKPAKVYPFKLDSFQIEAINHIEKGESVLVAAHTSAGKTAVAEYAIAKSFRDKQRVIYTSPIKALSNQKYRDLEEEFKDVGLMTGDMTINPSATCLIMTTEILRSMLYRGSEVIREVAWVIYDEVHYMRDKERGVVWEESIILLPHKVRFVFLSATIPNANEFVSWVSKIHKQPCHVVYTNYRPVPLQHYLFPAGSDGLYLVVDEFGKFREDNFQKAITILQPPNELETDKKTKTKSELTKNFNNDLSKIVKLIMDKDLYPCIIFSFSKKSCETYALQMARLDFNEKEEKELVEKVFTNAISALSEDDQSLPQVITLLPLLKRGIGIHHGGLLPILKEIIEILFQEGLIKCLFATETFSIGINMPAKTVVFTKTRKFDGKDFRYITSGEYIQMSGRAGRRGKDDKGIVIQMLDEKMEPSVAKDMIYGASDPLHSSYHVSYNMLLNMLRVEDSDPENILRASFHQYQHEQNIPQLLNKANEITREAETIIIENESMIEDYYQCYKLIKLTEKEISNLIIKPEYTLPFLQPGRVVKYSLDESFEEIAWGVIVSFKEIQSINGIKNDKLSLKKFTIDILIQRSSNLSNDSIITTTPRINEVIVIPMERLVCVSAIRLNLPKDLTSQISIQSIMRTLKDIQKRLINDGGIPLLDPIKDMGITSSDYITANERLTSLQLRLEQSIIHNHIDKVNLLELYKIKSKLLNESKNLINKAKENQSLTLKDTMKRMKRVLRRLQYITEDGVLGPKGRFACELTAGDELVLTDLVFDGAFNDISIEQTAALLSCFVHTEDKSDENSQYKPEYNTLVRHLQNTARNIARISNDAKIVIDEEDYVKSFNVGLIDVTHAWCSGSKFIDICRITDIFEGSIIRALRRLEELLRQLASASASIGNHELKLKFENTASKIRRGVVFAASLYV